MGGTTVAAVSAVVREGGRFLLVRRGHDPSRGLFAFPGGRLKAGESMDEAVRRELFEETGLRAGRVAPYREIAIEAENGLLYRLTVFRVFDAEGTARAGDDADMAGWYTLEDMRRLPVTESTLAIAESIAAEPSDSK